MGAASWIGIIIAAFVPAMVMIMTNKKTVKTRGTGDDRT